MSERVLEIDVLTEDIERGELDDCRHCALALAIRRYVAPYFRSDVSVGSQTFSVGIRESQSLPAEAKEWVARFDAGEKVEPFRFEITLPEYIVTGKFD